MDGGTTCLSFNRLIRVAIIKLTSRLLASWTWVSCCMQSSGQVATPTNDRWLASQVLLSEWECDETDDRYGVLWQPTTKAYSYSTTRGAWCRAKQEWTTRDAQQQRHRSPLELDSSSAWIHLPHTAPCLDHRVSLVLFSKKKIVFKLGLALITVCIYTRI
jgi:hypothetical protein